MANHALRSKNTSTSARERRRDNSAEQVRGRRTDADAVAPTRSERRKRQTRERLLDAALQVFLAHGYDGATTTEMARAADLGAGTFYLHFRDKRAVFQGIAARFARDVVDTLRTRMQPNLPLEEVVALALEVAAEHWVADPAKTRLLLEGGPSFSTEAHMRLADDIGAIFGSLSDGGGARLPQLRASALGVLVVGLALEIGRVILAGDKNMTARIEMIIRVAHAGVAAIGTDHRANAQRA